MQLAVRVEVKADFTEVENALTRIQKEFPQAAAKALLKAGQMVEADAKARCPSKDGTLRASITTEAHTDNANDVYVIVGTNVEYAPYVHQGTGLYAVNGDGRKEVPWHYKDPKTGEWRHTKGQHPQPFLRDAAESQRSEIAAQLANLLTYLKGGGSY